MTRPYRLTMSPGPLEHDIQASFVRMCRQAEARGVKYLRLGFAVPNGGYRLSHAAAAKLAAQGLRPGIPDWLLPVPCGGFTGLAIEFKRPGTGRVSEAQRGVIADLAACGWLVVVATCPATAFNTVIGYLDTGLKLPVDDLARNPSKL